jgi:hypothetical protein
MEFIFSPDEDIVRNPNDYMGSYGFDAYEEFHEGVIAMVGEEIVKLTKVLTGYYDITFEGGHVLHAISARSITMQPV